MYTVFSGKIPPFSLDDTKKNLPLLSKVTGNHQEIFIPYFKL